MSEALHVGDTSSPGGDSGTHCHLCAGTELDSQEHGIPTQKHKMDHIPQLVNGRTYPPD